MFYAGIRYCIFSIVPLLVLGFACSHEAVDTEEDTLGFAFGSKDEALGKSLFNPVAESDGKSDRINGAKGLPVSVDRSKSAVWEVHNFWADTDTVDAKKEGIVWSADSGLSWDEKYALWVKSLDEVDGFNYSRTFTLTTPFGKSLPAPSIECAETSLFLRATFASWYHLPFFIEAKDGDGKRLYLGHFGFRTSGDIYQQMGNIHVYI